MSPAEIMAAFGVTKYQDLAVVLPRRPGHSRGWQCRAARRRCVIGNRPRPRGTAGRGRGQENPRHPRRRFAALCDQAGLPAAVRPPLAFLAWIGLVLTVVSGAAWLILVAALMSERPVADALSEGIISVVLPQDGDGGGPRGHAGVGGPRRRRRRSRRRSHRPPRRRLPAPDRGGSMGGRGGRRGRFPRREPLLPFEVNQPPSCLALRSVYERVDPSPSATSSWVRPILDRRLCASSNRRSWATGWSDR
jgi:hypothetical protein